MAAWESLYLQNGCSVFSFPTKPKFYPGELCIFLDDGTFISAGAKGIRRFNRDQSTMWEVSGHYHHQINLTSDKNRILSLVSETTVRGKLRERDDVFIIHDLKTGKVLHRRLAWDVLAEKKIPSINWRESIILKEANADLENSHFNSFYEIPQNAQALKAAYLKPGNLILNSMELGIIILSPDLTFSEIFHPRSKSHDDSR